MAILDLLNRLGLFLDRSNFGVRVGNFRTNSVFENSILAQNARLQAIRFEKQFDINRGSVTAFEKQQRPLFEQNFLNPINREVQKTEAFRDEFISRLPKIGILQRSVADILAGKTPRGSGGSKGPHVLAQLERVRINRQAKRTTISPLNDFIQRLTDIRTKETNRINEIFNIVAPNSSI